MSEGRPSGVGVGGGGGGDVGAGVDAVAGVAGTVLGAGAEPAIEQPDRPLGSGLPAPPDPSARADGPPPTAVAALMRAFAFTDDVVGVTDDAGQVVWLNHAGRRVVGAEADTALLTTDVFPESVFEKYYSEIRPALLRGDTWTGALDVRTPTGPEPFWFTVVGTLAPGGEVRSLVTVGRSLAGAVELAHLASHDSLTGLANRLQIEEHLGAAFVRAERTRGAVAVVFVDVDGLKAVNDTFGHAAGDALLRAVGRRLAAAVRPTDVVGRLGGDEFLVVCEAIAGEDEAVALVERLQRRVESGAVVHDAVPVPVAASFGLAVVPATPDVANPERVARAIALADEAMYRAKQGGTGVELASGSGPSSGATASDVAVALTQRRIDVRLRPAAGREGGPAPASAVALWIAEPTLRTRAGEELMAAQFVPGVERTPTALALDLTVARAAVRRAGGSAVLLPISPRTIAEPAAVALLCEATRGPHCRPGDVTLLLPSTLTGAKVGAPAPEGRLRELRDAGFRLAAAASASGLAVRELAEAEVSLLVVGGDIVEQVGTDAAARTSVQAVIGIAGALGARVLATGIEDATQRRLLEDLGVDLLAGGLIG